MYAADLLRTRAHRGATVGELCAPPHSPGCGRAGYVAVAIPHPTNQRPSRIRARLGVALDSIRTARRPARNSAQPLLDQGGRSRIGCAWLRAGRRAVRMESRNPSRARCAMAAGWWMGNGDGDVSRSPQPGECGGAHAPRRSRLGARGYAGDRLRYIHRDDPDRRRRTRDYSPDLCGFELATPPMPENPAFDGSVTGGSTGTAVHEAATQLPPPARCSSRSRIRRRHCAAPRRTMSRRDRTALARLGGVGGESLCRAPCAFTAGSRSSDRELTRRRRDAAVLECTHSAPCFADVRVDEDLGEIVCHASSPRTTLGESSTPDGRRPDRWRCGLGVGQALTEETLVDPRSGGT